MKAKTKRPGSGDAEKANNEKSRRFVDARGRRGFLICSAGASLLLLIGLLQLAVRADNPGLTITHLPNDGVQITITNAVTTNTYVLYHRESLDTNYPWKPFIIGTNGQDTFTITNTSVNGMEWFQVVTGADWDLDGIFNWVDGNPFSSNVLGLTITIESPEGNSNIY